MGIFLIYILKSAVCLSLFYLFYRLLLSKETFHRFNRIALLGILFLSLLIPFIEVTTAHQTELSQTVLTVEQLLMMAEAMSTYTIDSCSRSIFQYRNFLNIRIVQEVNVIVEHTVYNIKRRSVTK